VISQNLYLSVATTFCNHELQILTGKEINKKTHHSLYPLMAFTHFMAICATERKGVILASVIAA